MADKLEVDSVTLEFEDRRILSDIYMLFETGTVTGILGRNGAGKSCLMKIIFGSLRAQYSSVRFNGNPMPNGYQQDDRIKYLPQFTISPKFLSLNKILSFFKCGSSQLIADFPEFENSLKLPLRELSFGQMKLFETYIFLTSNSKFILLDEPFSYLMPLHVEKLKTIINNEKRNKGIVITDHLYNDLSDVSDSIYLIYNSVSRKIENYSELKQYGYIN